MDKHIRPKDAAEILGVSPKTVYKLIDLGELTVLRVGRAISVPTASLADYIARNTVQAAEAKIRQEEPERSAQQPTQPPHKRRRRSERGGFVFLPPPGSQLR